VTLIPEMAVPLESLNARVSLARMAEPRPKRSIGMVWRRSSPLAKELAVLAEELKAFVAARFQIADAARHPA
jgi:LysR family hydrogen peroxide-inducible transcriptional activator